MSCPCDGARTLVKIKGDWRNKPLWIGQTYNFRYRFSPPMLRTPTPGGGTATVNTGRMQLRNFLVAYNNTGYFELAVTPRLRDTATYGFTGRVTGDGSSKLGSLSISDGTFRKAVTGQNTETTIELSSSSFLPCRFTGAEWEGFYVTRSRRIG